ncbi:hypothetical protein KIN20_000703 [Parelaphostrongylus tenuis]|uniref:Uncharacterized protein n=1 Tax=Parelaphostrongylus tenuis TaxID=148309 RepID=A0AAD5LSK4_PARTN|nr:hypothetical protein KIN20_000703 [Parelaphostrongylus tenuis]
MESCIYVGSTVTGICPKDANGRPVGNKKCQEVATAIDGRHLSFSGTLTVWTAFLSVQLRFIKKILYVDYEHRHGYWSRSMWQNVVDRALRMLRSGPFGSHFYTVTVTVS